MNKIPTQVICWLPNWYGTVSAEMLPGEISLKHRLRALIIEIQRVTAKIETIEFRNRSLRDCRVNKDPLKEIVIDFGMDVPEIEKLIAKGKKRSRDRHEFASTWYGRYPGNSLESQKVSSDEEETPGKDSSDFTRSSEDSLESEHQTERNIIDSNADVSSSANCVCAVVEIKKINVEGDQDAFMSKFGKEDPIEASREAKQSDCYTKSNLHLLKLPEETGETQVHSESNVPSNYDVNSFNHKLNSGYASNKREEGTIVSESEMENESSASHELIISLDGFRLRQEDVEAIKNWNWNINSNLNVNLVNNESKHDKSNSEEKERASNSPEETSYNSWNERDEEYYQYTTRFCKNRQNFAGEIEGANINPHVDVDSGLLTQNSYRIPDPISEKSEEISPDNFEEGNPTDTDEKDNRNSTDLPLPTTDSTKNEETEDNDINRQIDPDVPIAGEGNKDDPRSCQCTSSTSQADIDQNLRNIDYNMENPKLELDMIKNDNNALPFNPHKIGNTVEEVDSSETAIANEVDTEIDNDNDLGGIVDKRTDTIHKPPDNTTFYVTETSTDVENLSLSTDKNSNSNVNFNKLIMTRRHRRKPRNAPQRFNEFRNVSIRANKVRRRFGQEASVIRNESKADERKPNSMNILIDAVDEVLSDDTSRTAARDFSGNSKRAVR